MKQDKPLHVVSNTKLQFPQPASKQFAELAVGMLVDCYEMLHFVTFERMPNLSEITYVGGFVWRPSVTFDTLEYKGQSVRWSAEGGLLSPPFLTEAEWLLLIDKAWTEVVAAQSKAQAA